MDEQPDIVSSGPEWRPRVRWPAPGRRGWIAIFAVVLLACLGAITSLAVAVAQRDDTISGLRAALPNARHHRAPASPASAGPAPAAVIGSAAFMLPDAAGGSFSVVAVGIRPAPGSAAVTWLFVYGQHAQPGERYGVIEDTCGGQYVAAYDVAHGTADRAGDLTIVAPDLAINPMAPDVWILLYRWDDGAPLGGVQGPLTGNGARVFRSMAPC
jgi:hypothetical protein